MYRETRKEMMDSFAPAAETNQRILQCTIHAETTRVHDKQTHDLRKVYFTGSPLASALGIGKHGYAAPLVGSTTLIPGLDMFGTAHTMLSKGNM